MNAIMQALGAIIAGAIVAGALFYTGIYQDHQTKMEGLNSDLLKYEKQLSKQGTIEEELNSLESEINAKRQREKDLLKNSPNLDEQIPLLLKSLEKNCKDHNLQFADIRISPLIRNEQWSELPVEFTLRGTFHHVGKFLYDYERLKLINLSKGTLSISPTSEIDSKTKKPKVTVQLSGTIYVLNSAGSF